MTNDVSEARAALLDVERRQRRVIDEIDVPPWYWWLLAGGWVVLGVLAGAYAGWTGSLGRAVAEERLRFCERMATLPPDEFAAAMVPSIFSPSAPPDRVADFTASVARFRPAGFLAMALASAEADLTDVLGGIGLPTLLLYGDADVRAPLDVGRHLHEAIPGSRLVVLPGVGHASSVEAAELVDREIRSFLRERGERSTAG